MYGKDTTSQRRSRRTFADLVRTCSAGDYFFRHPSTPNVSCLGCCFCLCQYSCFIRFSELCRRTNCYTTIFSQYIYVCIFHFVEMVFKIINCVDVIAVA